MSLILQEKAIMDDRRVLILNAQYVKLRNESRHIGSVLATLSKYTLIGFQRKTEPIRVFTFTHIKHSSQRTVGNNYRLMGFRLEQKNPKTIIDCTGRR